MEKKVDRRIKKTKKQLQDGFTTLLMEKNIKDITVKELCDKVDLNRGTFYLHYKDIYDMAEKLENELLNQLESVLTNHAFENSDDKPFPLLLDLFILIKENSDFCSVLLSSNGDMAFFNKVKLILRDKCFNEWMELFNKNKADKFDYFYNFIVSGSIGIIESWLQNGLKESPEEISSIVGEIILHGVDIIK